MCFCVLFMSLLALVSSVPFLVFWFISPFVSPWVTLWVSGTLPGFISVLMLVGVFTARRFVHREAELVRQFGPEHALWVDSESWFSLRRHASIVVAGIDPLLGCPSEDIILSTVRRVNGTHKLSGWYENSSILWSSCILYAKTLMNFSPTLWYACGAFIFSQAFKPVKALAEGVYRVFKWSVYVVLLLATVSTSSLVSFVMISSAVLSSLWNANFGGWFYRLKLEITILVVEAVNVWLEFSFTGVKWFSKDGFRVRKGVKGKAYLADSLSKLGIVISDLGLPNYILSKQPQSYSATDIESSLEVMKELGWPINVELADPSRFSSTSSYAEWLVSGSSWQQGLHQRQMYVDKILDPLRVKAVEFRRTEEYMSLENELESIARYFKSPRYDFPDLPLDDVWFLIGDIFKFSKLAPFNHIIRLWEKKYALGSFMVDPSNPRKKYSRWKFISTIGYKSFKELWRRTFEVASLITPVAHVSVKGEALPPKKFLADKVRTVVGSPLGQYILSTVFNFYPNHNFRFESTPIKVGMPLNGFWFNKVYDRHSRCQVHFAGDFSDFDSTLSGNVREIIKAVRKRGFSSHKDVDRICKLIDLNYDQVNNQLLNTTSTGDIFGKGTGLTTGHSSTTMDNSIGSIVLYLMAWRELTGMDAQAFKHYVELDVFGDDHIISWLATSPVAWNFSNIQQVMSRWGLELREEASGKLENLPFLSKFVRRPNPTDVAEMKAAGVWSHGSWVVYHDKTRLLGKLVSKVKTMAPEYRLKRLLSYLSLTAHHKDIYDQLHNIITRTNSFAGILRSHKFVIPTYEKVLQDWYTSNAVEPHQEMDEIDPSLVDAGLVSYGSVSAFDSVLGILAQVPDIINPVLFNFGYLRAFQARGAHLFDWPFQLLEHTNNVWGPGELAYLMQRSPYSFLDPTIRSGAERSNLSSLLVRNFLFLQFKNAFRTPGLLVRLGSAHRKFAQIQFWLNGKVMDDVRSGELPIWQMALVGMLSFVNLPDVFPWLASVEVPNIPLVIEKGFLSLSNFFWSSLPPNYADVVTQLRHLAPVTGSKLSVAAPTGSGKSTALVKAIADHLPFSFSRVVVIEPRSAIVKGLVPYTQQQLAMDSSGATSGMTLDTKARVWYVTAQEALMHTKWWVHDTLFVMDECHIDETAYLLLKQLFAKRKEMVIYLSATPPQDVIDISLHLPLNTARVWNLAVSHMQRKGVMSYKEAWLDFRHQALLLLASLPKASRSLIFVNTVKEANELATAIGSRAVVLSSSSDHSLIYDASVIVSTSVADVGVTIPDVDTVLTSDIGFTVVEDFDNARGVYYRLSGSQLRQRVGRTGRTNHGQGKVLLYPDVPTHDVSTSLQTPGAVLDLLKTGVPVRVMAEHLSAPLEKLLGVDNAEGPAARDMVDFAFTQLDRYSENFSLLLQERAASSELPTATGEAAAHIDNARMGLVRISSLLPSSQIVSSMIDIVSSLAQAAFSTGETKQYYMERAEVATNKIGFGVKGLRPLPDPSLGEMGFD
jgi:hypothetical protein